MVQLNRPPTGYKTTVWLAPFWHSLSTFPFYPPYLIYLPTIRNCCNGASQLTLGFPPVTRAPAHMTSPHLTLPLYIPILYTSLQFFSTTFLLPFFITCHKNTPRSQDHHKKTSPPFKLPLCIPFLYSSLQFFYTPSHMTSPLLTLQLYTFSLPPLYSIHPLSTSTLYILNIVGYCYVTAQLHTGEFPKGVGHRVENGWGLTKVAVVLLNGPIW